MSVTLSEVKRAAKAHRAPLAGESAGYLVLAIADQVLSAPRLVEASGIQLTEDGALRVVSGNASSDVEAELALRRALDQLLLVASSGSAALTRASRRTAPVGLAAFVRELEAALIPVNRAAARRALARVQRETSRALLSGLLPAEEPEVFAEPVPLVPVAPAAEPVSVLPAVAATPVEVVPVAESHLDGVLTALCQELLAPAELQESDAGTISLAVRPIGVAPVLEVEPELEVDFDVDFDVEFETEAHDSGEAPTVMRAVDVHPVVLSAADELDVTPFELPAEARTRPEPAMIRKSLRALLPVELPLPPDAVPLARTPTLGSLVAQLPVLDAAQRAQLAQRLLESELELERAPDLTVVTSAPVIEEGTEPMPEVAPLPPGVAMVASRKSEVNELLSSFHIEADDSNQGLCRAIKEMADLDLTPAPFAALVR
ncbi:MAG: hypothetical protein ABIQ16_12110 [Polyangiaceae bacterium]